MRRWSSSIPAGCRSPTPMRRRSWRVCKGWKERRHEPVAESVRKGNPAAVGAGKLTMSEHERDDILTRFYSLNLSRRGLLAGTLGVTAAALLAACGGDDDDDDDDGGDEQSGGDEDADAEDTPEPEEEPT